MIFLGVGIEYDYIKIHSYTYGTAAGTFRNLELMYQKYYDTIM